MIVRDAGDAWQLVLQTDHADLCRQLVEGWGGDGFPDLSTDRALLRAADRHDDGWAVWERAPRLDPATGAPQNFIDVDVPVHLAFYRAAVEAVCEEDPAAGLLVSMHMSGLYRGRYGVVPGRPKAVEDPALQARIDLFCDQEEERQAGLIEQLDGAEEERWQQYTMLQVVDLLSLTCQRDDLESGVGAPTALEGVPLADGSTTAITVEPVGPWRFRLDPYPFAAPSLPLTMVRRMVPKAEWATDGEFRADFAAAVPETVRIFATS